MVTEAQIKAAVAAIRSTPRGRGMCEDEAAEYAWAALKAVEMVSVSNVTRFTTNIRKPS